MKIRCISINGEWRYKRAVCKTLWYNGSNRQRVKKISAIAETKDLYAVEAAPGEVIGQKATLFSQQYSGSAVPFSPLIQMLLEDLWKNTEVGEMFRELLVR